MKINLSTILGGFNLSAINDRLKKIEDEFNNKVLYRDNPSDEPNQMQVDLDMNGHRLLNVSGIDVGEAIDIPKPAVLAPQPIGLFPQVGSSVKYAREDHVHVGLAGSPGQAGAPGKSNALVYAYKRSTSVPTDNPGNIVYDLWTATITEPAGSLANGWSKTIPDGTNELYVTAASASSDQRTDAIGSAEWTTPVKLAVNGQNGVNGLNAATVYIYLRTPTAAPPTLPSVNVTYTFSPTTVSGLNNGWAVVIPDVVYGDYLWVSTATAASTTNTDSILPSEWAPAQILGRKGDAGKDGANGGLSNSIVHAYKRSATVPTDNPGNVTWSFTSSAITVPDTLGNGWQKTIPSGSDPLYVVSASASGYTATDDINATEWSAPVALAKNGLDGLNNATVYIYKRATTNTPPALPTAQVTYTFATAAVTGLNGGWQTTVPSAIGGDYLFVSTATAASTTATDVIETSEWSAVSLFAQSGVPGVATATLYAYKRSATAPVDNPGSVVWTFASANITTPSTDALANGWTKTIPAGSNPLYVTVSTASGTGLTDTVDAAEWSTPVTMAKDGAGLNVATIYIYQRTNSASPPALPSATTTYTFSTNGFTGLNNGWTKTIPSSAGGAYLWVSTATASSNTDTDDILSTEWAGAQVMAKDGNNGTNGSNGSNGQRGTVTLAYAITGSSWSNTEANNALLAGGYFPAQNRDIITLYNTSANYSETRFYDSGSWIVMNAYINGNMLVSGTLSANKITTGTLNSIAITAGTGHTVSNKAFELSASGILWVDNIYGGIANFSNSYYSGYAVSAISNDANAGLFARAGTGPAISAMGDVLPYYANSANCGNSSLPWAGMYCQTALTVTSDVNAKTEVEDSDLGLSFVMNLRPVSYRLIEAGKEVIDHGENNYEVNSIPGVRRHYGLIAQEVKEALGERDAAFWILSDKDDPNSPQALRYEELIAPLIKSIQELNVRLSALENSINP